MPLPQAYRDAAYPQETGEVFTALVTIDHDLLEAPIRLNDSGADITTGGHIYIDAPFEIVPPGQSEDAPQGRLIVPNVDQRIGEAIEALDSAAIVDVVIVLASDPTIVCGGPYVGLELKNVRGDAMTVQGDVSWPSLSDEPWPQDWISAGEVPGSVPSGGMIAVADYISLQFQEGGRARPAVDCWGLYRLIVGETAKRWLSDYAGVESNLDVARTLKREQDGSGWIRVLPDEERELDLVLMRGFVGEGARTVSAPLHVGCVTKPGWMIDAEETNGVLHRPFRDTRLSRAHPTVKNRVLGVYRPEALA